MFLLSKVAGYYNNVKNYKYFYEKILETSSTGAVVLSSRRPVRCAPT